MKKSDNSKICDELTHGGKAEIISAGSNLDRTIHLGNMEVLRFCAAMMVVLYHYAYVGPASYGLSPMSYPELLPITQHRWVGAWLFFMISGFGIAYSARHGSAVRFLIARVARIYPAFLFCMCATSIVLIVAAPQNFVEFQVNFPRWFANLTMAPMLLSQPYVDGVYWSIAVEIVFYLGVGFFLSYGLFQRRQLTILAVWLGISFFNEFWVENATISKLVTRNSCFFVLGILSYRVFAANRKPDVNEMALALLSLVLAVKSDYAVNAWLVTNLASAAEWNAFYALAKTVVALAVMNVAVRAAPVIKASWSTLLGSLSFPIYLLHSNIGFVLFHHTEGVMNRWLALLLVYSIILTMAYGVARFIEPVCRSQILRFADRLLKVQKTEAESNHHLLSNRLMPPAHNIY